MGAIGGSNWELPRKHLRGEGGTDVEKMRETWRNQEGRGRRGEGGGGVGRALPSKHLQFRVYILYRYVGLKYKR